MLPVFYYQLVDSTMDVAKRINQECVVVALSQTAGRGKPGSSWSSQKGNFLCSLKIYNHLNLNQCQLSVFFGLVIGFAVNAFKDGLVKYKYPNDVYVNNKKLAGVLIEFQDNFVIVGLGVNLKNSPDFATKLREYDVDISVPEFTAAILKSYTKLIELYIRKGWHYLNKHWDENLLKR